MEFEGKMTSQSKPRLFYIDNIRLLIIVCVVMHHLAVTYSGNGSWYYIETAPMGALPQLWFSLYLSFQQAYFMGAMFLFAGYFTVSAYNKKGFGKFLADRFTRLIIPALFYMIIIAPFMSYVELGNKFNLSEATWIGFLSSNGVMWFTIALFIFSAIYALGRKIRGKSAAEQQTGGKLPFFVPLALTGVIALGAFIIRLFQPLGTNVFNMQLGNFSSYIFLFIAGILSYRYDLLSKISFRAGKNWLIGAVVSPLLIVLVLVIGKINADNVAAVKGGLNGYCLFYALWESFVAVAMCAGLVGVVKAKFNRQNKLMKALSDSSFAVYMFHPPIIVAVTLFFKSAALPSIAKWFVLSLVCVPLCFAAAYFILRKIPVLNKIL